MLFRLVYLFPYLSPIWQSSALSYLPNFRAKELLDVGSYSMGRSESPAPLGDKLRSLRRKLRLFHLQYPVG